MISRAECCHDLALSAKAIDAGLGSDFAAGRRPPKESERLSSRITEKRMRSANQHRSDQIGMARENRVATKKLLDRLLFSEKRIRAALPPEFIR